MSNNFWESDQIRLRRFQESDWKKLHKTQRDSHEVRLFEGRLEPLKTEASYQKFIQENIENPHAYAIENKTGDYVGIICINNINESHGTFGLVVQVFKDYRERGYAKEAMLLMLKYAFGEMRMNKANTETIDINDSSVKLHGSIGFTLEGTRKQNTYTNGKYHDEILFGMTKEDFFKQYLE